MNNLASAASSTPVKPVALRHGDVVGIVAPASSIKRDLLEAGCNRLRELGYRPFYFESILEQDLYFAGPSERRARELEQMFEKEEVRAIVCARGGYGSNYLLPSIDLEIVRQHPKIFVGYSDLTSLLTYIADASSLVTFHGPMVTKDFATPGGVDLASWEAALNGTASWPVDTSGARSIMDGAAEGKLYGGCLSILVASLGTPYEIHPDDGVLFLEDVAAKPYQIDRMLMQLKLAGKLNRVRGLVFGEMIDCVQNQSQGCSLEEVIRRVVQDLGVPVAFGLRSGHVSRANVTLPLGIRVKLEVKPNSVELQFLEAATVA